MMKRSNFREWTLEQIETTFALQQKRSLPVLEDLLAYQYPVNDYEKRFLQTLSDTFVVLGGDDWNEVELENKLISPLVVLSEIANERYSYFLERELTGIIGDFELVGKVDGMIATGFRSPKVPFFCMSEYKRGADPNGDPRGQALIAMMVAQQLNENTKPVFGSYVIGRNWYFMVLEGNQYAISQDFSCANIEGITAIYTLLKSLSIQIEKLIK